MVANKMIRISALSFATGRGISFQPMDRSTTDDTVSAWSCPNHNYLRICALYFGSPEVGVAAGPTWTSLLCRCRFWRRHIRGEVVKLHVPPNQAMLIRQAHNQSPSVASSSNSDAAIGTALP